MDNKELIGKLKAYYLTQDPETVCYALASLMIDINRVVNSDKLGKKEFLCLDYRLNKMVEELNSFAKNGPRGDMKVVKIYEAPTE